MELELQTDQIARRLSVMYYDTCELLNRAAIKKWLSEIEKNVTKSYPDFIILRGCCRYILFELQRKEWCKYYFLSNQYAPNQPVIKSHLVLSRYPLTKNETFVTGDLKIGGINHIVEIKIPFNDLPMRYEYEDLDVQQIDNETIYLMIVDNIKNITDGISSQTIQSAIHNLTNRNNPPTVILTGLSEGSAVIPQGFHTVENTQLSYLSEAWELNEYNERTQLYEFELLNFD
jgi:hypothetical protein